MCLLRPLRGRGSYRSHGRPGPNATVLAHNDLAVETPGTHEISWGPGHNFNHPHEQTRWVVPVPSECQPYDR